MRRSKSPGTELNPGHCDKNVRQSAPIKAYLLYTYTRHKETLSLAVLLEQCVSGKCALDIRTIINI